MLSRVSIGRVGSSRVGSGWSYVGGFGLEWEGLALVGLDWDTMGSL